MSNWREDFSTCTLEEVLGLKAENRAWSKQLRLKNTSLVNSRLANDITQADYQENRKVGHERKPPSASARANLIDAQIVRRRVG